MTKEFVIETRDGFYVRGFVGVPAELRVGPGVEKAERYANRWAALEACNRGGTALHMARIVPYSPETAREGSAKGRRPKKAGDASKGPRRGGNGHL